MTRCQEDLNAIPEVSSSTRTRNKNTEPEGSVEGMEIAVTINRMVRSDADPDENQDDWCYTENSRENFDKIVSALKRNAIPATVDFIAGDSLDRALQLEWQRTGNLIGNMTYDGRSVKKGSAQEFIGAISKNEEALAPLSTGAPGGRKYFRFPSLKLGTDPERTRRIRGYLNERGYVEVPATIDPRDDYFAQPYCAAIARGDTVCANFIAATFKSFLLDKTTRTRASAVRIAGHDVKHILMIQANQLMCDSLDDLLRWYRSMGVRFISLDEALRDPFYAVEDVTTAGNEIIWETRRAQMGISASE